MYVHPLKGLKKVTMLEKVVVWYCRKFLTLESKPIARPRDHVSISQLMMGRYLIHKNCKNLITLLL